MDNGISLDLGRSTRNSYIALCVLGSIGSYYMRTLFFSQYSYSFQGCSKEIFNRPWFATLIMSLCMSLCLVIYIIWRKFSPNSGFRLKDIPFNLYLYALLPALSDLGYSLFYSYSISHSGTISIALRYFELLFVVIVNYFVFKQHYFGHQWFALGIVFLGIVCVFISVILAQDSNEKIVASAIILQIIAQLAHAFKTNFEQKITHNNDVSPWWLTGVEGIYQFFLIFFRVQPNRLYSSTR